MDRTTIWRELILYSVDVYQDVSKCYFSVDIITRNKKIGDYLMNLQVLMTSALYWQSVNSDFLDLRFKCFPVLGSGFLCFT